jgi:hypothetical protein
MEPVPRKLYLAAALAMAALGPVHAQTGEWTPPHPMLLTPERALAMLTAFDRQLDYVPGEVLVQFRPGVSASGTARAAVAPQQTAGVRSAVDR